MSQETIKTYQGSSIGASQCLVTLEGFIGDMENAELADDSTVDASDAVTAINGLIWEIERREAEVERLTERCEAYRGQVEAGAVVIERLRAALEFYRDPFAWKKLHDPENDVRVPDFYSETSFGDTAEVALADQQSAGAKEAP